MEPNKVIGGRMFCNMTIKVSEIQEKMILERRICYIQQKPSTSSRAGEDGPTRLEKSRMCTYRTQVLYYRIRHLQDVARSRPPVSVWLANSMFTQISDRAALLRVPERFLFKLLSLVYMCN